MARALLGAISMDVGRIACHAAEDIAGVLPRPTEVGEHNYGLENALCILHKHARGCKAMSICFEIVGWVVSR